MKTPSYLLFLIALLPIACSTPTADNTEAKAQPVQATIITLPKVEKPTKELNVGFLIMDGVFNTELTAPMDIFQHSIFHTEPGMKVFTIAATTKPITTFEGLKMCLLIN